MIKRNVLLFGNKTISVIQFLAAIKAGKSVLYAHPDFVAMGWKDYKKLTEKKPTVVFDEMIEPEKDFKYRDEK